MKEGGTELYPVFKSAEATGNKLYNQLAKIANKSYGAKGKEASQLLQKMVNKAGLTVKPGGKHLKVFNSEGHFITTIPHSPHSKGVIKGIIKAIMKEAGF